MSRLKALKTNRLMRVGGFFVGIVLFYAPFAALIRLSAVVFPTSPAASTISDVHSACLRMPIGWLAQPWMWPTMGGNPLSYLPLIVLPLAAVAAGPMFCGWLCPAGALPEHLGRLVPDRFKFDFKSRVDIVPLRYGFFVGFLFAPFISTSICCSFCNFTHMQNFVSGTFGDASGFAVFTSLGVIAAATWIVPLGLFTKGGRGWCMFLCPAGTTMGLASKLTAKWPWAARIRADHHTCTTCGTCSDVCPMRAIDLEPVDPPAEASSELTPDPVAPVVGASALAINHHLCNECLDCVQACPSGALRFGRPQ